MTKSDSSVFPWTSTAQSAHLIILFFFSVQLIPVAAQLLRAPEEPGVRCLALLVSPACTGFFS